MGHRLLARRFHREFSGFADRRHREIWGQAARELEAELIEHGHGYIEFKRGQRSTWVWRHFVALDDIVAHRRSLDKEMVHRLLAEAHLPIPQHVAFGASDLGPALSFLKSSDGPCVVKPADGTGGGMGISTGVRTTRDLVMAIGLAGRHGARLLIERQAPGEMYRLLFLDGELLDVVRRRAPHVVGDGRSTIRQLIAAENRVRLAARGGRGFALVRVDLDCLLTLRGGGWSMRSVPAPGELVKVKTASSENRPEDNQTVRDRLDDDLVANAAESARACGLRLAGIDIIAIDPTRPPQESGAVIIEVNCTPGLTYHYHVQDAARATPVAVPVLRRLLAEAHPPGSAHETHGPARA